mmetsp:Transcript_3927/g.8742  ORF Transcript_3927/g.8742 Transcript_3927/m.8742 type:complete len:324 (-) Transcript_3927:39-1010(-)
MCRGMLALSNGAAIGASHTVASGLCDMNMNPVPPPTTTRRQPCAAMLCPSMGRGNCCVPSMVTAERSCTGVKLAPSADERNIWSPSRRLPPLDPPSTNMRSLVAAKQLAPARGVGRKPACDQAAPSDDITTSWSIIGPVLNWAEVKAVLASIAFASVYVASPVSPLVSTPSKRNIVSLSTVIVCVATTPLLALTPAIVTLSPVVKPWAEAVVTTAGLAAVTSVTATSPTVVGTVVFPLITSTAVGPVTAVAPILNPLPNLNTPVSTMTCTVAVCTGHGLLSAVDPGQIPQVVAHKAPSGSAQYLPAEIRAHVKPVLRRTSSSG